MEQGLKWMGGGAGIWGHFCGACAPGGWGVRIAPTATRPPTIARNGGGGVASQLSVGARGEEFPHHCCTPQFSSGGGGATCSLIDTQPC